MVKKTSIARDFTIFSGGILLVVLFVCLLIGVLVHHSYYERQDSKISHRAALLDSTLEDSFNFISHYVSFVGNKISTTDHLSVEHINDLLKTGSYKDPEGSLEWTIFSWISSSNKVLTSSVEGVIKTDIKVSNRQYLKETPHHPWRLIFSVPTIGVLSHQLILPAGFGITKPDGTFLGTISIGFGIDKLTSELSRTLASDELVFILLDSNFNYILSSREVAHTGIESLINHYNIDDLKESLSPSFSSGKLLKPIENSQYSFTYLEHSTKYPFYFLVGTNKKIVNSEYWRIVLPRIVELCIMGIFFIIVLYYFRRRIITPLLALAESAKKIAEGDNNTKIHYGDYEEVDLLAEQLKDIQKAKQILASAKKDADLLNITLENKIKERTADLEKALAIRTEFLNSMSHEVRTPVQGITSISKGLVEHWNEHSEEKKFALASAVASNSQRLFSLVSNVLDLSTFNTGGMHFNMQKNNLISLIDDIITECEMLYLGNKPIKIIFNKPVKDAIIVGDSEKISQVLRNLITNSIKFMKDGEIEITVVKSQPIDKKNSFYTITIKDEGVHLPDKDLSRIFLPFVQSNATRGKASGAGLGLSICHKIIIGHGGKIWAFNNADKGISISFTLPVLQKSKTIKLEEKKHILSVAKGFILVVDDEAACQMSMDLLLSGTGYTLISKYGGVSALEYLKDNYDKIDLIFLDLMMPDMYGLDVLEAIHSDPKLNQIPVVIQSGTNDNLEIERTLRSGARAFIRKPYQRQQILDVIDEVLGT